MYDRCRRSDRFHNRLHVYCDWSGRLRVGNTVSFRKKSCTEFDLQALCTRRSARHRPTGEYVHRRSNVLSTKGSCCAVDRNTKLRLCSRLAKPARADWCNALHSRGLAVAFPALCNAQRVVLGERWLVKLSSVMADKMAVMGESITINSSDQMRKGIYTENIWRKSKLCRL